MGFDIIGDVHGHADRLEALLALLGYENRLGAWRHPTRTAVFVGDLIDRGPGQLRTLGLVRAMWEAGTANVVMGNHELNAIAWATPDPRNNAHHLRPRHGDKGHKNHRQHEAFLSEVGPDSPEHAAWIEWFYELPLWIERPDFRVVHACWDPKSVDVLRHRLRDGQRLDAALVQESNLPGSAVGESIDIVLKGAEVRLPEGVTFRDKEGHERDAIRIRWWNPALKTYRDAYIGPDGVDMPDIPMASQFNIPEPDRPTFIGHYWFDPGVTPAPAARRVACVDYSAAKGGPLAAYRFDGEPELSSDKFVTL
jgi:hypothetical protein